MTIILTDIVILIIILVVATTIVTRTTLLSRGVDLCHRKDENSVTWEALRRSAGSAATSLFVSLDA